MEKKDNTIYIVIGVIALLFFLSNKGEIDLQSTFSGGDSISKLSDTDEKTTCNELSGEYREWESVCKCYDGEGRCIQLG